MVDKFDKIAFQLTNSISIHNYFIYKIDIIDVTPEYEMKYIKFKKFHEQQ